MRKRIFAMLVILIVMCNMAFTLSLADLSLEDKILVEDAVLAEDTEITPEAFESLEGIKYYIIYKTEEYTIVKVGDRYVLIVSVA